MKRKALSLLLAVLMPVVAATGCNRPAGGADEPPEAGGHQNQPAAPTEGSDGGGLVFERSMELSYAKCFAVDYYKGGYKLVSISDGTKLLVVPEGMDVSADAPADAIILRQPVDNIMAASAPVVSLINAIGALDAVSLTTSDADAWYIDEVKSAVAGGSIAYVGDDTAPDYEKITAAGSTLAFYSAMLTEDVAAQLGALGVDVVVDRSADEEHPLARVEWVKLYGALFNREDRAEEVFNAQAARVDGIAGAGSTGKTAAIFYITSKGALYARNAGDYMAKMVELAGGTYALADVGAGKTGTAHMEPEAFYDGAGDADHIIYIWSMGGRPERLADVLDRAGILAELKAVREGNVWCTTPDFFQAQNAIGDMIGDVRWMLASDGSDGALTYLRRLK